MQVRVENLTKEFGTVKAVDDVTFAVADGKLTGLLGPPAAVNPQCFILSADWKSLPREESSLMIRM